MVNSPSIRPYLLEGVALGGTLDSHDGRGLTVYGSKIRPSEVDVR